MLFCQFFNLLTRLKKLIIPKNYVLNITYTIFIVFFFFLLDILIFFFFLYFKTTQAELSLQPTSLKLGRLKFCYCSVSA